MVEGPDVKLICQNDHCTVKIMFENECTLNALESYGLYNNIIDDRPLIL